MRALATILMVVSYLLVGAHFLRAGHPLFALVLSLAPVLLILRRREVRLILSVGLGLALVEWTRTFFFLKRLYEVHGLSFGKAGLILGAVILLTLVAALLNLRESFR